MQKARDQQMNDNQSSNSKFFDKDDGEYNSNSDSSDESKLYNGSQENKNYSRDMKTHDEVYFCNMFY